jgi:hypothetical protein
MPSPEELKNLENSAKLRDLGIEWSDRLVKEFMEKVGKSHKAEERALFYMTLGSDLLARMYQEVRKDFEERHGAEVAREVAQKLLSTGLSMVPLLMRRHGADVQASVTIQFEKVANSRLPEACDHSAAKKCACELDADGRCAACLEMFRKIFSNVGKMVQVMKAGGSEKGDICIPCAPRHMDAALAQVIREELAGLPKEMSEAMMEAMFMSSQNLRSLPMPLSKKAWNEIQSA